MRPLSCGIHIALHGLQPQSQTPIDSLLCLYTVDRMGDVRPKEEGKMMRYYRHLWRSYMYCCGCGCTHENLNTVVELNFYYGYDSNLRIYKAATTPQICSASPLTGTPTTPGYAHGGANAGA
jgi:hypothetical protein